MSGLDGAGKSRAERLAVLGAAPRRPLEPASAGSGPRGAGRWRPIYAVWEITLRCDLACDHCGSRAGRARPDELSTAEALDLVDQLGGLGVEEVTLIGGEAYLRDDWTEIAQRVRATGMRCSMTTGGRGLDEARARAARAAGIQQVSVSIDGLEATHDRLRGVRGSHRAALRAMMALRAAGVPATANTQIGRANLAEVPAILETIIAAGARAWQFQLTVAMGRAADSPELLLEPYQMLELLPMLAALRPRADGAGVRMYPGNNVGYFGPHERVLRDFMPGGHSGACGAGRQTIGIEANGDVKGCPSLPTADYVGGNVRERPLAAIWTEAPPLRFTRERTVADLWGYCRECYYAETCMSGCSWTSHVLFGRPGNNPFCHHRALELARAGKRERLERVAAPPGRPFDQGSFRLVLEDWPEDQADGAAPRPGGGGGPSAVREAAFDREGGIDVGADHLSGV